MQQAKSTFLHDDNLLPYVQGSHLYTGPIDRDRAMEFVRKCTPEPRVFKLFLMGASIAFSQVRKSDQEVLSFFADFLLDKDFNHTGISIRRVIMRTEIRREAKDPRKKNPSAFYEFVLIVNEHGHIVDVDFSKLEHQLFRNLDSSNRGNNHARLQTR